MLEQYILDCWRVTDDMDAMMAYLEGVNMDAKDMDTLFNMMIGVKALYNQKFNMTFQLFEEMIKRGDIK